MTNNPSLLTVDEKLKAAFYHSVSNICRSTGNDNNIVGSYTFDKNAIELISEIMFKKLEIYSEDLEAFSKNRKQTTVNTEDVKLLARRNPQMESQDTEVAYLAKRGQTVTKEHLTKFINDSATRKNEKKKKGKMLLKKDQPSSSNDVIEID